MVLSWLNPKFSEIATARELWLYIGIYLVKDFFYDLFIEFAAISRFG
jgi:hypothetical protein